MQTMSLSQAIANAKGREDVVVRAAVVEIGKRLVLRSPVGNPDLWLTKMGGEYVDYITYKSTTDGYVGGHFRANWQLGVGSAPSGEVDSIDKTGNKTIAKIRAGMAGQKAGRVYYLVNNLPYAQALENGHSTQAPQGMVRLTMIEANAIFNNDAKEAQ